MTLDNAKTVAKMLHISMPTLYRWVKANKIPHLRRGHRLLFNKEQIIKWMDVTNSYKEETFYNQIKAA